MPTAHLSIRSPNREPGGPQGKVPINSLLTYAKLRGPDVRVPPRDILPTQSATTLSEEEEAAPVHLKGKESAEPITALSTALTATGTATHRVKASTVTSRQDSMNFVIFLAQYEHLP